jgi:hypothetical protein
MTTQVSLVSVNVRQHMTNDDNVGHPPKLDTAKTISTTDVRQGVTGHNVRYVLAISIIAAIIAMAGITVIIAI